MKRQINHRDLEQCIGGPRDCDDYLKLKIAGIYSTNNKISIAAERGVDKFFIAVRGPKSDLSEAILLDSRYVVIGNIKDVDTKIFEACTLQNVSDAWMELPEDLFTSRLLIAGAARIIVVSNGLTPRIAQTPEYQQALADNRVIELIIC